MRFAKKIIVMVTVYACIVVAFFSFFNKDAPRALSDNSVMEVNKKQIYTTLAKLEKDQSQIGKTTLTYYRNFVCATVGEGCTNNPADGAKNFPQSISGFTTTLLAYPYLNPPASGLVSTYETFANAGVIPKTYAAEGIGFSALQPFSPLWKIFRDVSYLALVLVMVSIGFMVMFRMKINAQTVISAENALPKIIFTLLIITFSFAIAGFIIDLMYILIAMVTSLLSNNNQYFVASDMQTKYLSAGFGTIYDSMFPKQNMVNIPFLSQVGFLTDVGNELLHMIGPAEKIIRGLAGFFTGAIAWAKIPALTIVQDWATAPGDLTLAGFQIGSLVPATILTAVAIISGALGSVIGATLLPQLIIGIFIFFTIILLSFRIFFMLLKSYLQILILLIFAPIILIFEATGRHAFSYWFKNLFAEMLTFPLVVTFFLIGYIFVNESYRLDAAGNHVAPLWQPPFLYPMRPEAFGVIAGMGILFIIPSLVKLVREFLGVKGMPIGLSPGVFFAGAGAAAGGAFGAFSQYGSLAYTAQHLGVQRFLNFLPGFGEGVKGVQPHHGGGGGEAHQTPRTLKSTLMPWLNPK